jgi:hypothetical protein
MKKFLTLVVLTASAHVSFAQPAKPTYAYYEGFNLSMGVAQNSTEVVPSTGGSKAKSMVGVFKVNYTFALAYPAKLGLTATFDLKNSKVSDTEVLASNAPTEISIEPGILLITNSLLYAKLGAYSTRYESNLGSRSLSGKSYGIGIKHYAYGQNFIQLELTQRSTDNTNAGLGGDKFKQSSAAALVGFNY